MNWSMMDWSEAPPAWSLAIRSLAGLEKLHSSISQVATVSEQPHWQARCLPTRFTSALGFRDAVCARAATVARTAKRLLFHRYILFGNADYFRARVLHFDLARNQSHQRAADQHDAAQP